MIYLDNAATTLQKPPCVGQAMLDALEHAGNPGRGAHEPTLHAARIVYHARETLATLLHAESPDCIAFTANVTQALNTALCGLVRPGDHVITTVCEHNSVLRPLYRLREQGAEVSFVEVDDTGRLRYEQFEKFLRPNTRLVVVTHASNVTGNLTDLAFVSTFAKSTVLRLSWMQPRPQAHDPSTCRRWGWMFSVSPDTRHCWVRRGPAGCMSAPG